MARLEGRRALVTGASSGIGAATARRLAVEGAAVAIDYVGREGEAKRLRAEIEADGGRAVEVRGDVSSERDVVAMFARASEALGGCVDLLVNNAGIEKRFELVDMPLGEWQAVLDVNLTGPFLCAREAARGMIAAGRGGAIVNVSSVHERIPWPGFAHYCASKGGLALLGQTIAKELAPHGIRVVGVAPGAIMTPINEGLDEHAEQRRQVEEEIPLGYIGRPEQVAEAVAWVASDAASYVTGTTLFVDGGMTTYPRFV
ncbi:MAG: glucose 1-dehydrogenase [Thermoleophilaceae bacterium]|nr:glucose 1-dehydrogenase [Thermoleophilaceae bacterium]